MRLFFVFLFLFFVFCFLFFVLFCFLFCFVFCFVLFFVLFCFLFVFFLFCFLCCIFFNYFFVLFCFIFIVIFYSNAGLMRLNRRAFSSLMIHEIQRVPASSLSRADFDQIYLNKMPGAVKDYFEGIDFVFFHSSCFK